MRGCKIRISLEMLADALNLHLGYDTCLYDVTTKGCGGSNSFYIILNGGSDETIPEVASEDDFPEVYIVAERIQSRLIIMK